MYVCEVLYKYRHVFNIFSYVCVFIHVYVYRHRRRFIFSFHSVFQNHNKQIFLLPSPIAQQLTGTLHYLESQFIL